MSKLSRNTGINSYYLCGGAAKSSNIWTSKRMVVNVYICDSSVEHKYHVHLIIRSQHKELPIHLFLNVRVGMTIITSFCR